MPAYPASPQVTLDALLKTPILISRALTDLTKKRFVADRIFAHGSPEMVAAGSVNYQRSESIYPDRVAEEVGVRAEFPRSNWTEAVLTALVKKYGMEVPISFEAIRRNQLDQLARAQVKISNAITKLVDTLAMTLITTDAAVLTGSGGNWTTHAAGVIIGDIANAIKVITDQDEGYEPDTLVCNPAQNLSMMVDPDIRGALPRESNSPNPVLTGQPAPLLGLKQILQTPQLAAGTVLILTSKLCGTIADEAPGPLEGYSTFAVNANEAPPILTKVYEITGRDEKIVRGARLPAMFLAEPKSIYKLTVT